MSLRAPWLPRVGLYAAAILISLWILLPIYFIALAAFSSSDSVFSYPKDLLPTDVSLESMRFFFEAAGVTDALLRSIYVAVITIVLTMAIATPAGYAVARFAFRGADAFRLSILATRAFPIIILSIPLAVTYLRWGIDDSIWGVALAHTALALPFAVLVISSVFASIALTPSSSGFAPPELIASPFLRT